MIVTSHISRMLAESHRLAADAAGPGPMDDLAAPESTASERTDRLRRLERAANLAEHAAAELRDELLRARDGWGQV